MEDFIEGFGITQNKLAVSIGVPPCRINVIVHGKRGITADTAIRLARYFGTSEEFWMNLQSNYELRLDCLLAVLVLEEELGLESCARGEALRADPSGEVRVRSGPRAAQADRPPVLTSTPAAAPPVAGEALAVGVEGVQNGVQAPLARGAGPQDRGARGDVPGLKT